jgi:hypothetical protein
MENQVNPLLTTTPIIRGTNRELVISCFESIENSTLFNNLDAPTTKIQFDLCKSRSSGIVFSKKTITLTGGSDSQVKVNDSSNFSIFFDPPDTLNLKTFIYVGLVTITLSDGSIYKILFNVPII